MVFCNSVSENCNSVTVILRFIIECYILAIEGDVSVKLIKKQIDSQTETEVEIRYAQMDTEVAELIKRVEQAENCIYGTDSGRQYKIRTTDIYYAESVDKKTFIYTKDAVFRSELRLFQLIEMLKTDDFVQVSRSCVLNIDTLDNIQTLLNSRMEGTLINGEKITISRTYIPNIRAAFTKRESDIV